MKRLCSLLCIFALAYSAQAQTSAPQRELGLAFNDFDSFGVTYKFGTQRSLWRINTAVLAGNSSEVNNTSSREKNNSFAFSAQFGKEFRKSLSDNLEFRYGADVSFQMAYAKSEYDTDSQGPFSTDQTQTSTTYTPGINLVIGANYAITESLWIGAEIMPSVTYSNQVWESEVQGDPDINRRESSQFNFGINNFGVLLNLSYRW